MYLLSVQRVITEERKSESSVPLFGCHPLENHWQGSMFKQYTLYYQTWETRVWTSQSGKRNTFLRISDLSISDTYMEIPWAVTTYRHSFQPKLTFITQFSLLPIFATYFTFNFNVTFNITYFWNLFQSYYWWLYHLPKSFLEWYI